MKTSIASIVLINVCMAFFAKAQELSTSYPKLGGHFGIMHPIVMFMKDETNTNFRKSYTVGFPTGINIMKNDKVGFSFEVVPFIKSEGGKSKLEKYLFHPGVIFRFKNGFTFTARAAFESAGRYGFTPVFTKIVKKNKDSNFYLSFVSPARFGNMQSASVALGVQVGISF